MPALHRSSICPAHSSDATQRRVLCRSASRFAGWLLLCGAIGCSSGGGQAPPDVPVDLATPSPDLAMVPRIFSAFPGCGPELFTDGTKPEDFSSQMAFEQGWLTAWTKPQVSSGALSFGPHPLSADWWENYSPATTRSKPGDVLLCARLRMMAQKNDPVGDNSIELTMRIPDAAMYETAGMVLLISGNAAQVSLRTRTGPDSWVHYAQAPLAMDSGVETAYDVLLYGQGSRFVAEVRNTLTGQIAQLRADSPLPAGGAVSLVGWRSRNGIAVDKLMLGQPSVAAAERLMTALSPLP